MFGSLLRVLCAAAVSLSIVGVQAGAALGEPNASSQDATARAGADAADPAKILLYGDSLTMGFSGDWTWRYRVWRDLTSAGQHFDFVGPRDDLLEFVSYKPGSQGYRDPHFDRDHAAYGGMTFTRPLWEPSALVDSSRRGSGSHRSTSSSSSPRSPGSPE